MASVMSAITNTVPITQFNRGLAHARALSILHYHECYISPMQGNLPTFQLNATV